MAVKAFPNDRDYTYEALIEMLNLAEADFRDAYYKNCASVPEKIITQLNLVGQHFSDGSFLECSCNLSKHMPTILGYTKEGIRMAKDKNHKEKLIAIRDDVLAYKRRLDEGQLNEEEADELSNWVEMAIDEMNAMQREWKLCVIDTASYMNKISGLAGEGVGFTNDENEKRFMQNTRDMARQYSHHISSGKINDNSAEAMREWAREQRRRIATKTWKGDLPSSSRKDEEKKHKEKQKVKAVKDDEDCPTCTLVPEKYRKKKAEVDYRYVSVDDGAGGLKGAKVPKQESSRDIRWVMR